MRVRLGVVAMPLGAHQHARMAKAAGSRGDGSTGVPAVGDAPPPVHRDPWALLVALMVVPVLLAGRGLPLGELVADDFDFLNETYFHRPDWLPRGGRPPPPRPLAP